MEKETFESIIKILKSKKQIVLQGAPGTGKTFVTAEIAVRICDGCISDTREAVMTRYQELMKEGRIAFTTFHQSMDYEQFVEGFVPQIIQGKGENDETKMVYSLRDGIFKNICRIADQNKSKTKRECLTPELVKSFYSKLVELIKENKIESLETQRKQTKVTVDDKDEILTSSSKRAKGDKTSLKFLLTLGEKYPRRKNLPSATQIHDNDGGNGTLHWAVMNWMFDELDKLSKSEIDETKAPCVLIIDEINRGNISKILGELITLLEADKRAGETNCVTATLPYSNEKFAVPSNLYIIGTMNTADRSVGYIDYAVRRRFAFINIKADREVIEDHYEKHCSDDDLKNYALEVYDKIKDHIEHHTSPEMKSEDVMIGHSYFLAKDKEEFDFKLKYEIRPLLDEYFADGIITEKLDIVK